MQEARDRYRAERLRFELALRMIGHEARTQTISLCTGLSHDRIRKIYSRYFSGGRGSVRRRRGKSPRQTVPFVRNAVHQLEATTLTYLFVQGGLLQLAADGVYARWQRPDVEYGHRVCRSYETYQLLHPRCLFSFEWAWNLLQSLSDGGDLGLTRCNDCGLDYLHDRYGLNFHQCPACEIRTGRSRRPGHGSFARS
jgi:hypothetical protein